MPPLRDIPKDSLDHTSDVLRPSDASRTAHFETPSLVPKQRSEEVMNKYTRDNPVNLQPHEQADETVRAEARRRNPHSPAKELARAAQCDPRTAESWMAGKTGPGKKHLFRLMASWGSEFITFLIEPVDETFARKRRLDIKTQEILRSITELAELSKPEE